MTFSPANRLHHPTPPNAMTTDFNGQWKNARTATDEAESIRTLTKILSSKEGRTFVFNLEPQDAAFCIEMLDHVSSNPTSHPYPICHSLIVAHRCNDSIFNIQGLAEHQLRGAEKQTFFVTLRRLAGKHARLPQSMVITDKIEYSSNQPQKSGGFADIKPGRYRGCDVAVKVLRVARTDNFEKIRKVSGGQAFAVERDDTQGQSIIPPIAILQGSCPLEFVIASERPEVGGRCG